LLPLEKLKQNSMHQDPYDCKLNDIMEDSRIDKKLFLSKLI